MEEGAVEAHAVVDDDEIALQAEPRRPGQDDDAVGRGDDRSAGPRRDVDAAVIGPRLAAIDSLSAEAAADSAGDRPGGNLPPALPSGSGAPGGVGSHDLKPPYAQQFLRVPPTQTPRGD